MDRTLHSVRTLAIAIVSWCLFAGLPLLSGCTTIARGGPESFLTVKEKPVANTSMEALRTTVDAADRNKLVQDAMSDVDVFYVEFRDELLRSDNHLNSAVDIASLASDLAGKLATSTGAKDNYFTLGALLNGTRSTINLRYLHSQTTIALIKGMDAARSETELAIKSKFEKGIDLYTGRDAFADVLKYYFDGTLAGGLLWIQANATQHEAEDRVEIANLPVPTPAMYDEKEALSDAVQVRFSDTAKLRAALKAWGKEPPPGAADAEVQQAFREVYASRFDAGLSPADVRLELDKAGFFKDTP